MWRATAAWTSACEMPRAWATRATWYAAASGLMSGSRPDADVVTRSTGIGAFPYVACIWATWSVIRWIRSLFVGPRFEPAELFAS